MSGDSLRLGVIPARVGSSRFPNKILVSIGGKPMIQHVWEAASKARRLGGLLVATDHPSIASCVESFGGRAILTGEHPSGTDRVASVVASMACDLVVNIQGDEPLLDPASVDRLVEELDAHPECGMATLAVRKRADEGLEDRNVVKVVLSEAGEALYFSREPLRSEADGGFLKHIGIYGFRRELLLRFAAWPPSRLEQLERLEQLRALERGVRIRVAVVGHDTVAVDTPDDVARVERILGGRA